MSACSLPDNRKLSKYSSFTSEYFDGEMFKMYDIDMINHSIEVLFRHPFRLMPRPQLKGEGLAMFGWFIRLHWSWFSFGWIASHTVEHLYYSVILEILGYFSMITTLLLYVCKNAYSKLWIYNKAWGTSQMSPDPLLLGRVWEIIY